MHSSKIKVTLSSYFSRGYANTPAYIYTCMRLYKTRTESGAFSQLVSSWIRKFLLKWLIRYPPTSARIHEGDEDAAALFAELSSPSRVLARSLSPSLALTPFVARDSQSAIIRPRNCPERHFLAPFRSPHFTRPSLLRRSYRPSSSGTKAPFYHLSSIPFLSLSLCRTLTLSHHPRPHRCSTAQWNMYSRDREP